MNNKKLFNNKIAKGLVSLIAIIALLSSILATSIFYQGNITGYVVQKTSIDSGLTSILVIEVNDIKELSQLNEGWYEIRNGFVFYLDTFNSYVPLWVKVKNPEQQNGLFVVDENGNIEIYDKDKQSIEKELVEEEIEVKSIATTITGKVTGLEKVSGFATKEYATLDLAISGYNKKEFTVGDIIKIGNQEYLIRGNVPRTASEIQQPILFKSGSNIGETLFGSKAAYLNQQQQVIITNTPISTALNLKAGTCSGDVCKQIDGSYILISERTQTTQLKPPTFDISNPEKFKTEMDTYIQNTIKIASAKKEEGRAKPLIDAANNWAKNPNDPKTKERFDFELKKWEIYQETKTNPSALISYLSSSDKTEQTIARDLIIQRRNEQDVRENLLSAAGGGEAREQIYELNQLVQLEQKLSPLKVKVDFTTGELIDRDGKRGYGIKPDGTIDPNIKGPTITKEQEKKINEIINQALNQYQQQIGSEQLTQKDGKLLDTYGREITLTFNSQIGLWTIISRQSPQTIKTEQGLSLTKSEYLSEINGQSVSVYRDATGKLYDYTGKELKERKVKQASKFGTIDTEIVYEVKEGQVDKEKPVSARIGSVNVPSQTYAELLGFLKAAGQDPKIQGEFTQGNPLVITDKDGKRVFAQAYSFENFEGIRKGITIKSDFKDGQPLLIKTTSEDGKVTIVEKKDFIEIDTGKKDAKGQPIKEKILVTKDWVKIDQTDMDLVKRVERTYKIDEKGRQTDYYTEITTNSLTGEPLELTIKNKDGTLTATYNPNTKEITGNQKAIEQLSTLRTQFKTQRFFATVERIFTEFQGLGYYATLFFEEDELLKWRDNVDRIFATLYLGTEYWSSAICGQYLDGEDIGIAYAETPQGLAQVGAHIEATRTEPIETISVNNATGKTTKETQFIYKITFNVRNGDYDKDPRAPEEMNINVVLKGERTVNVFKEDQKIKRGKSFGKTGRDAIVQESKVLYDKVCLTFDKIPLRWRLDNKELCNKIQESSGAPTAISTTTTTAGGEGGAAEGGINDF